MQIDNVVSPDMVNSMLVDPSLDRQDTAYTDFMAATEDKNDFFTSQAMNPDEFQMRLMSGKRVDPRELEPKPVNQEFKPVQSVQPQSTEANTPSYMQGMNTSTATKNELESAQSSFSSILKKVMDSKNNAIPTPIQPTPQPISAQSAEVGSTTMNEPKKDEFDWTSFFSDNKDTTTNQQTNEPSTVTVTPNQEPESLSINDKVNRFFDDKEKGLINSAVEYSNYAIEQTRVLADKAKTLGYNPDKFLERINNITPDQLIEMVSAYDRQTQAMPNPAQPVQPQPIGTTYKPTREIPGVSLAGVKGTQNVMPSPSILPQGLNRNEWQI